MKHNPSFSGGSIIFKYIGRVMILFVVTLMRIAHLEWWFGESEQSLLLVSPTDSARTESVPADKAICFASEGNVIGCLTARCLLLTLLKNGHLGQANMMSDANIRLCVSREGVGSVLVATESPEDRCDFQRMNEGWAMQ